MQSAEEMQEFLKAAVEKAVRQVMYEENEQKRAKERQRIIYNTRILMENYIEMKKHVENAISEEEQCENEAYNIFKGEKAHLESVRWTKMKTALMIENIDRAISEIEAEYRKNEMSYKAQAFKMHYVSGISFEEVSDILNCGKNSPSRWSKEILKKMAVKLFGIEGIEKW